MSTSANEQLRDLIRRIGGLEKCITTFGIPEKLIRRIGGLENTCQCERQEVNLIRRIGGLEIC